MILVIKCYSEIVIRLQFLFFNSKGDSPNTPNLEIKNRGDYYECVKLFVFIVYLDAKCYNDRKEEVNDLYND